MYVSNIMSMTNSKLGAKLGDMTKKQLLAFAKEQNEIINMQRKQINTMNTTIDVDRKLSEHKEKRCELAMVNNNKCQNNQITFEKQITMYEDSLRTQTMLFIIFVIILTWLFWTYREQKY